jgi:hypothetical protein
MLKEFMKGIQIILFLLIAAIDAFPQVKNPIYICRNGRVSFLSEAPLELIKAKNGSLSGVLNITDRSFSFQVPTKAFEGFISSFQREHFNEYYMETELFPYSTFKGKIIEEYDLSVPGEYEIRAKGKLIIHGVEVDRIIRCALTVTNDKIDVNSSFTIFIADYSISIPSILNQKIATEISVNVKLSLLPSELK